ncbi:MAG TPA: hypothetical protein VE783_10935 [Candidatus Limnocylindrales bacterium]|nr:hypothetical protein [Candidatus Limnocylindrales bacterium]
MNDNRLSAIALIAGSAGLIITMAFHPTGHDFFVPGQLEHAIRINMAVHSLALASMPISFLGALGLSLFLNSSNRLAMCALVCYGVAEIAGMNAGICSGFVASRMAQLSAAATGATSDAWKLALRYTGELNQAFAPVLVVATSVALILWSCAILRSAKGMRALAIYGLVIGSLTIIGVSSGHVRLNVHGFGVVVLTQSIWFVLMGVRLWNADAAKGAREGA